VPGYAFACGRVATERITKRNDPVSLERVATAFAPGHRFAPGPVYAGTGYPGQPVVKALGVKITKAEWFGFARTLRWQLSPRPLGRSACKAGSRTSQAFGLRAFGLRAFGLGAFGLRRMAERDETEIHEEMVM
jgi:hypothetical protein